MSHMGKGRDREPGRKGLPCLRKPTIRKVKSIVSGVPKLTSRPLARIFIPAGGAEAQSRQPGEMLRR